MWGVAANRASREDPALTLTTEVGLLSGTWHGSEPVQAGDGVDVELEFARPRSWSEITAPVESTPRSMTAVQGTVSATFDDEVIGVMIGGAAVLLELDAPPPPDAVGRLIVLTVDDLEFHPTGAGVGGGS